jgi:hypothetical protein
MATREKKSEFAGLGCLLQGIGLVLLFFFPIGTVVGIALILWGSWSSVYWRCSACKAKLPDKSATICAACRTELT